jgi:hypothetical protein
MVARLSVASLLLWTGTAAADPYGCLSASGRLRMLVASPPVCLASETAVSWGERPATSVPARPRRDGVRIGAAALLAAFALPRTASR